MDRHTASDDMPALAKCDDPSGYSCLNTSIPRLDQRNNKRQPESTLQSRCNSIDGESMSNSVRSITETNGRLSCSLSTSFQTALNSADFWNHHEDAVFHSRTSDSPALYGQDAQTPTPTRSTTGAASICFPLYAKIMAAVVVVVIYLCIQTYFAAHMRPCGVPMKDLSVLVRTLPTLLACDKDDDDEHPTANAHRRRVVSFMLYNGLTTCASSFFAIFPFFVALNATKRLFLLCGLVTICAEMVVLACALLFGVKKYRADPSSVVHVLSTVSKTIHAIGCIVLLPLWKRRVFTANLKNYGCVVVGSVLWIVTTFRQSLPIFAKHQEMFLNIACMLVVIWIKGAKQEDVQDNRNGLLHMVATLLAPSIIASVSFVGVDSTSTDLDIMLLLCLQTVQKEVLRTAVVLAFDHTICTGFGFPIQFFTCLCNAIVLSKRRITGSWYWFLFLCLTLWSFVRDAYLRKWIRATVGRLDSSAPSNSLVEDLIQEETRFLYDCQHSYADVLASVVLLALFVGQYMMFRIGEYSVEYFLFGQSYMSSDVYLVFLGAFLPMVSKMTVLYLVRRANGAALITAQLRYRQKYAHDGALSRVLPVADDRQDDNGMEGSDSTRKGLDVAGDNASIMTSKGGGFSRRSAFSGSESASTACESSYLWSRGATPQSTTRFDVNLPDLPDTLHHGEKTTMAGIGSNANSKCSIAIPAILVQERSEDDAAHDSQSPPGNSTEPLSGDDGCQRSQSIEWNSLLASDNDERGSLHQASSKRNSLVLPEYELMRGGSSSRKAVQRESIESIGTPSRISAASIESVRNTESGRSCGSAKSATEPCEIMSRVSVESIGSPSRISAASIESLRITESERSCGSAKSTTESREITSRVCVGSDDMAPGFTFPQRSRVSIESVKSGESGMASWFIPTFEEQRATDVERTASKTEMPHSIAISVSEFENRHLALFSSWFFFSIILLVHTAYVVCLEEMADSYDDTPQP